MSRMRQGARAIVGSLLAMLLGATAAHAAYAPYPVSFSLAHAVADAAASDTALPGTNNFACKPSREHPQPVVLVHGLIANQVDDWDTMAPLLADNGFCVFAFTYGTDSGETEFGGLQAMEQSAQTMASFVDRVLAATGASQVDLVGHSEGTVMPRYWMEFLGGAAKVKRYVMLAPIWHGTNVAGLATVVGLGDALSPSLASELTGLFGSATSCGSCSELLTGSPFLQNLDAHGWALPGVSYTDIVTKYDELVNPYTSGILDAPNVVNITIQDQCSEDLAEHLAIAYDPVAGQDMLNALDPAHARPVPCVAVLPALGAPDPPSDVGLAPASRATPKIRYALEVTPGTAKLRSRTRFVLTASIVTGSTVKALSGAVVRFAQRSVRTNRFGRAEITAVLHRSVRPYRALLMVRHHAVASAFVRTRR